MMVVPCLHRLILAANRDEYYHRPAKSAQFWSHNPEVLSGLDMEEGRQGGAWLGVSRSGRLSGISNCLLLPLRPDAKGKGCLVADFLASELDCLSYTQKVAKEANQYNGFNLICAEFQQFQKAVMCYFNNFNNSNPVLLEPGIYGLGNATLNTPWTKLLYGKRLFTNVINRAVEIAGDSLTQRLMHILSNKESQLPDPLLEETLLTHNYMQNHVEEFSALCVESPSIGTRTHTVILINAKGEVTFTERTLVSKETAQWQTSSFRFTIHP
uniref:Transport and Golgi organization protein 2 homolog n=1 Tax=Callorhinchus milii TaxID=7868 RepID=A0A4W3GNV6_CALMI|eukprot:gi/632980127/ref/XP_007906858.1/ PREDICTED: transport and Golgi organization protein 2 homolog isoform X2 [Callorhinchus milii]